MSRTRRTRFRTVFAGAITLSVLMMSETAGLAAGAGSAVTITTVDGQAIVDGRAAEPVSGKVTVSGSADAAVSAAAVTPLVADAGDSSFVASGERAVLLGSAYGGVAPYTFEWSTEHGKLSDPKSSSTELDTAGLDNGHHDARLTVTDATGKSTSDTVTIAVFKAEPTTLLDTKREDVLPGVTSVGPITIPFDVAEHTLRLDASVTWTNELNDYDLYLYEPGNDTTPAASSGGPAPQTGEATGVADPKPGEWTLEVDRWLTFTDTLSIKVTGLLGDAADPRPEVTAGGPYTFVPGAEQKLTGKVSGGSGPVAVAWDVDNDGVFDTKGKSAVASLPEGRHFVTFKATDADGLERRETTTVLIAGADVIESLAAPVTVIGVADTGINPYHLEFSAKTYPDPDVLALTDNFTRHPGEYIPGYPKDATALTITHGEGYFPSSDAKIWDGNTTIQPGELYWIPGTKIIGAMDAGGSTGATSGDDPHPILDDNGHGSGSASVSAGNRYGYCPTCLLVVVEALDETVVAGLPWVDISTNSFGYIGGAPVGPIFDGSEATKKAAERGQTTLFAAGNGVGNAFDVPIVTWHSDKTGPDWNITVGAIRRDHQRAIIGDGMPAHVSSWGDGNLPSACGTGTVGQCAFGGTSAATPYTAGVFGTVLTQARAAVGDGKAGQKPGQVVVDGIPREDSTYLQDGKLTRAELREVVLKSAEPLGKSNNSAPFPYPATAPYTDANVLFEGYGAATPEAAERAIAVLMGDAELPDRSAEDEFFALDRAVRDTIWGGYDRTGSGTVESEALHGDPARQLDLESVNGSDDVLKALRRLSQHKAAAGTKSTVDSAVTVPTGEQAISYFLHRRVADAPGKTGCSSPTTPASPAAKNEQYMDRDDTSGDAEPCFENRATSVAAAYRPLGIFAATDTLDAPLPTGSTVNVELYVAGESPSAVRPTGVLMATDREIGKGETAPAPIVGSGPDGAGCEALGEACWTKFAFNFTTTRPPTDGEHLTFQVQLIGARSWAFGYEGAHASKITIEPAEVSSAAALRPGTTITSPGEGSSASESDDVVATGTYAFPELGDDPTGAGDHPVSERVEVSVDDKEFADPKEAVLDAESGTWSVQLGKLEPGEHTIYARTRRDTTTSEPVARTFTTEPKVQVEWKILGAATSAAADGWMDAKGLQDWSFDFDTADYGAGEHTIVVRQTDRGKEVGRDSVQVQFGQSAAGDSGSGASGSGTGPTAGRSGTSILSPQATTGKPGVARDPLATTGVDLVGFMPIGLGMVVLGGTVLLLTRRRPDGDCIEG